MLLEALSFSPVFVVVVLVVVVVVVVAVVDIAILVVVAVAVAVAEAKLVATVAAVDVDVDVDTDRVAISDIDDEDEMVEPTVDIFLIFLSAPPPSPVVMLATVAEVAMEEDVGDVWMDVKVKAELHSTDTCTS
eukprot:Awhi_evm1s5277